MTTQERILAKRIELQRLKAEEERMTQELRELLTEQAESLCPIAIGTKVEYEPGKFGQVDRIEYHLDSWDLIASDAEVSWAVTGRKINRTGEFGVKDFHPVGPATHFVDDTSFKPKGLIGIFGISDDGA